MIKKVISGGQTGADIGGLVAAKNWGFLTGGNAAKDYLTEKGTQESVLRLEFNLSDHKKLNYSSRNIENVKESDATIIFGYLHSKGSLLTKKACKDWNKVLITVSQRDIVNQSVEEISTKLSQQLKTHFPLSDDKEYTVNIAGNRESKNLGIQENVYTILWFTFQKYLKGGKNES